MQNGNVLHKGIDSNTKNIDIWIGYIDVSKLHCNFPFEFNFWVSEFILSDDKCGA